MIWIAYQSKELRIISKQIKFIFYKYWHLNVQPQIAWSGTWAWQLETNIFEWSCSDGMLNRQAHIFVKSIKIKFFFHLGISWNPLKMLSLDFDCYYDMILSSQCTMNFLRVYTMSYPTVCGVFCLCDAWGRIQPWEDCTIDNWLGMFNAKLTTCPALK